MTAAPSIYRVMLIYHLAADDLEKTVEKTVVKSEDPPVQAEPTVAKNEDAPVQAEVSHPAHRLSFGELL